MAAFQADRPDATSGCRTISEAEMLVSLLLDDKSGVFVSASLTKESHELLLSKVPPKHPYVHGHHMTIAFNPPMERFVERYEALVGQPVRLRVVGVAEDDKGQAVRVEGPSENANPHITISCADGIAPKYSNEFLSKGWKSLPSFELEAVVEARPLAQTQPINPS
jgi:hypothetical protein